MFTHHHYQHHLHHRKYFTTTLYQIKWKSRGLLRHDYVLRTPRRSYKTSQLFIWTTLIGSSWAASKYVEDPRIVPKMLIERVSPVFDRIRDDVVNLIAKLSGYGQHLYKHLQKSGRLQNIIERFPCNTTGFRSVERPSSVHRLMAGDVDVVAAMGDSLNLATGGMGSTVFHSAIDNRGIAWATGGQGTWRNVLTVANILREFNPNLVGYSYGDATTHSRDAQFNVAEIGAMSKDMLYQAKILIKRMKSDSRVNFLNDWKLVFILIGSNNFCSDICYTNTSIQAELHRRDLIEVFDYMKENMPRTLVALFINPHLKTLVDYPTKPICYLFQRIVCSCLRGLKFVNRREEMYKVMDDWRKVQLEVVADPRFMTETFALVPLSFGLNAAIPQENGKLDFSYLASDCFHLSQKGNAAVANAAWNNLIQPISKQQTRFYPVLEHFECPTMSNPFLTTMRTENY